MQKIPVRHITTAPKDQGLTGRFSIRRVETIITGEQLVHDLHRHDFFFLLAIHKGKGIHEIDFIRHEISNNTVFLLRPGQVHRLELKAGSTGYLMEFDQAFYRSKNTSAAERWKRAGTKNFCKTETAVFEKLYAVLTNIFNEFTDKKNYYPEAIIALLDLFFIEFIRVSQNPANGNKPSNGYTQERFEELLHLLEQNIGSMKQVSEYADKLNLSPYQLNAITKESVGKTVSELINEQIVLEAKRLLLATPSQVKEVADHLGYEDVSYFIRFFKKQTGLSPEAFRKNFK